MIEIIMNFNITILKISEGKSKVTPLLARLWPRGWVEV
jgi:hypothetical protein